MRMTSTKASLPAIRYSTYIDAPIEKVFKTLTTAEGWDGWFTKGMKLDLRPGGEIEFVWRNWAVDHVNFEDGGKVVEVKPNEKFSFTWHRNTTPTTVTFKLKKLERGTSVEVTDDGYKLEEISHEYGGFAGCASGWGEAITLLKVYVEHGITTVPFRKVKQLECSISRCYGEQRCMTTFFTSLHGCGREAIPGPVDVHSPRS